MPQIDSLGSNRYFDLVATPVIIKKIPINGNNITRNLSVIPFHQYSDLICKLDYSKHSELNGFYYRFGGLCELVCNRILIDDLLEQGKDENYIKKNVTVERMNEDKIKKSHLLDVYSLFHRAMAFAMGIYPDNIFSPIKQWKLVNTTKTINNNILRLVERNILSQGLKKIKNGETLKLEVFCKEGLSFAGHSLLIKKIKEDKFIFFDPNSGEHRGLSMAHLSDKIDEQLAAQRGTDIFLLKGKDYLKRLKV